MISNKKSYTKKSLFFSLLMLMIWALLGTGTTLAWFTDTTPVARNTFDIGELDLKVSYKDEQGQYVEVDESTNVFDDYALYEPGYVQVVYFKVENVGTVAFDYSTAITVNDYKTAVNKYGQTFSLSTYLLHGVVVADTESELMDLIDSRTKAVACANTALNNYNLETSSLNVGQTKYMALIVRMPEEVGNEANHSGSAPEVKLGLSIRASQQGTIN